ncbi:hypothetical protein A1OK_10835 [Enterovibrio norvegicus FF-454]|uniref:Uncharacterized protein n=1 Tax=Enterovibrio norvegicus FF-454 TaxID=1185651 RepID=A0A1E5C4H0_9GAMM|nr:hypothetical protein [Enterovibrio norvegicus]OEE60438.1 hypothetical protein A1OK_10835 [Enterovibrio norvegicus FF-454]
MQKRRFYRLEEFTTTTSPTKGDLLNAVDKGKLTYCALVDAKAVGSLLGQSKPISSTLGQLFDYKGVVKLSQKQSQAFNLQESAEVKTFLVLEPEKVSNARRHDAEFPKARVRLFDKVRAHEPISGKPFWAYAKMGEQAVMGDDFKDQAKDFNATGSFDLFKAFDAFRSVEQELVPMAISINQKQLMVDSNGIDSLFVKNDTVEKETQAPKQADKALRSINRYPLNDILDRLLDVHPNALSDQLWVLLSDEVKSNSDERVFDVGFAIDDIDDEERVIYHVRRLTSHAPETTSYDSFKNIVSRRKKRRAVTSS